MIHAFSHLTRLCILWLMALPVLHAQEPFGPEDFPEAYSRLAGAACDTCDGTTLVVDAPVVADFSGETPTLQGGAALSPFVTFEKDGQDPRGWRAVFDLGGRALRVTAGGRLTTFAGDGSAAPALAVHTTCDIAVEPGGFVGNPATNAPTGTVLLTAGGGVQIAGTVESSIAGTWGGVSGLTVAAGCGGVHVTPTGSVLLAGAQQGGGTLNLLAFGTGGDVTVDGLVESRFGWGGDAAAVNAVAFGGDVRVDGNTTYGLETFSNRRISSGIVARTMGQPRVTTIRVQALHDVALAGYGLDPWRGAASHSFQLHEVLRGSADVPVTVTLTNTAPDQVEVRLDAAPDSGGIKAFFGNVTDHALLANLTVSGPNAGSKRGIAANGVDGLPNFWMSPPGGWDFGFTIGEKEDPPLHHAELILSAPGLTWEQLIAGQASRGMGFAVVVVPAVPVDNPGKNDDGLARMGIPAPVFQQGSQFAALTTRTKGPGGVIQVRALEGRILAADWAIDNSAPNGGTVTLEAWDAVSLTTTHPTAAALEGGRMVVNGGNPGGTTTVRSLAEHVLVGEGAVLSSPGGAHVLTACSGVTVTGTVTPADTDPSDDTGTCPPPLALTLDTPVEGALLTNGQVPFAGTVSEPQAEIFADALRIAGGSSPWQADVPFADGVHSVTVTARRGSREAQVVRGFTVDTQPPAISLAAPTTATWGDTVEIAWNITDTSGLASVSVTADGTVIGTDPNGTAQIQIPANPDLTDLLVTVQATDLAGLTAEAQAQITIQPAALTLTVTQPAAGTLTAAATLTVSGTVSPAAASVTVDGLAAANTDGIWTVDVPLAPFSFSWDVVDPHLETIEVSVDDTLRYDTASGSDVWTPETAGEVVLRVHAADAAGNTADHEVVVAVTGAGLALTVDSPAEGAYLTEETVVFTGGYTPEDAQVTADGAPIAASAGTWTYSAVFGEGTHAVVFEATTADDAVAVTHHITVDLTNPTATLSAPTTVPVDTPYTVSWDAADTLGLASVVLTLDGEPVATDASGSLSRTPTESGVHTYHLEAVDLSGRIGVAEATVTVQDGLLLTVDTPAEGAVLTNASVTLTGSYAPVDGTVTVDGEPATAANGSWTHTLTLADGSHDILVLLAAAGQTAEVHRQVTVDTQAPTVTITMPDSVYAGESFTLTVTAADPGGATDLTVSVDGTPIYDGPGPNLTTQVTAPAGILQDTYLEVSARAVDAAGSAGTDRSALVVKPRIVTLTVEQPVAYGVFTQETVTVSGTVAPTDAQVTVDGLAVTRDGAAWSLERTPGDGSYTWPVTASYADFTPAEAALPFVLDTQPPTITLEAPPVFVRGETYTLIVTCADLSGLQAVDAVLGPDTLPTDTRETLYHTLTVPLDETADHYTLTVTAVDQNGFDDTTTLDVPVADDADLDRVVVTVLEPTAGALHAQPGVAMHGTVDPPHARVTVNGAEVATDGDGGFTTGLTLTEGLNLIHLEGRAAGFHNGVTDHPLYLDRAPPRITLTAPGDGLVTDQPTVTVQGVATDLPGQPLTLTRDGLTVPHTEGAFSEVVTLNEGANTLTYTAVDGFDQSANASVTVVYDPAGPGLHLTHPDTVPAHGTYAVSLTMDQPADIVSTILTVNGETVYEAPNGAPYAGTLTHDGFSRRLDLVGVMIDRGGNRYEARGTVTPAFPHYVHGRVFYHDTGYPAVDTVVQVTGPAGTATWTTDSDGAYAGYVDGAPFTLRTAPVGYLPVTRIGRDGGGSARIPDMRLTPRGANDSLNPGTVFSFGARLSITVAAGFGAGGTVTGYGPQNIPLLLPLGYAPVEGFSLAELGAGGILDLQLRDMPGASVGETLLVLLKEGHAWRVTAHAVIQPVTNLTLPDAATGDYLLAVPDAGMPASPVGTLLERTHDAVAGSATAAQLSAVPQTVSILADPATRVTVRLDDDGLPGGTLARVGADEVHDRFGDTVAPPPYRFDVFCYRFGEGGRLAGRLPVRARETVAPGLTRYASIHFQAYPAPKEPTGYLAGPRVEVGDLSLDFTDAYDAPRVLAVDGATARDLTRPQGSRLRGAFQLQVGLNLARDPRLTTPDQGEAAMVLLARLSDGVWVVVDLLTRGDGLWRYEADAGPLRAGGTFAVVGLAEPAALISGTVTFQGQAQSDVLVGVDQHPWPAYSDAAGAYRAPAFLRNSPTRLSAYLAATRRSGGADLPSVTGPVTGLNLVLDPPDFRVVDQEPAADQRFVDPTAKLVFQFSQPVSLDLDLLHQGFVLGEDGGAAVGFDAQLEPGGTTIVLTPTTTLRAGTTYRLRSTAALQSRYGDTLRAALDFRFQTAYDDDLSIDLRRFLMRWTGTVMYLEAPADAVVPDTELRVDLVSGDASASFTLGSGAFSEPVDAVPGNRLALKAVLPNGAVYHHIVSSVTTPDGLVPGPTGFTATVSPTLDLVVDTVEGDGRSTVTVDPLSEGENDTLLEAVGSFDTAGMTFVEGLTLGYTGDKPILKGTLTPRLDLPAEGQGIVLVVVVSPEVYAPYDPNDLSLTAPKRTAFIADQLSFSDGALVDTGRMLPDGRVSLNVDLSTNPVAGLTPTPAAKMMHKSNLVLEMAKISILLANPLNAGPQKMLANCTSYPHPDVVREPSKPASWHNSLGNRIPVPGAPVFGVEFIEGSFPQFLFLATSDTTGRAEAGWVGVAKNIQVVDPQTGQFKVGDRSSVGVHDGLNFLVVNQTVNRVTFDPAERYTELGLDGEKPPVLTPVWEVLDNGTVNSTQTDLLVNRNTLTARTGRTIRLSITSDKKLTSAVMSLSGLPAPDADMTSLTKVVFTLPEGLLGADRLLNISVDLEAADGTNAQVRRAVLIGTPDQGPAPKPGAAVQVITVLPEADAEDVPIGTEAYLSFSEPVTGVGPDTISLTGAGTVELDYFDRLGSPVTPDSRVTEVYIVPKQTLKFATVYTFSVSGLTDTHATDPEMEPFSSTFETAPLDDATVFTPAVHQATNAGWQHTAFSAVRNLVFYMHQTPDDDTNFQLDCFDERDPRKPLKHAWSARLWHEGDSGRTMENLIWSFQIFTPRDLDGDEQAGFAAARERTALDDLPLGSKVVVTYTHHREHRGELPHLRVFNYDGGGNFSLDLRFPLSGRYGYPDQTAKIGPYLVLPYRGGVGSRGGGTEVLDMRKVLDPVNGVQALLDSPDNAGSDYLTRVQRVGLAAEYVTPSWVQGSAALLHRGTEGIRPVVLAAGAQFPAIYRFDPTEIGDVWATPAPDTLSYDKRLLARTTYDGFTPSLSRPTNTYGAGVEALSFRDPADGVIKTRDIAIFTHFNPTVRTSVVQFYILPPNHTSVGTRTPDRVIRFDTHVPHIAADPVKGLLAVTASAGRYGVLDVRRVLEQAGDKDGFEHEAFLFPPKDIGFWRLFFNNGVLYAADDTQMRRVVVDPSPYRTVGWEVAELDGWLTATSDSALTRLSYARELVLQTTDLINAEGPRFAAEMADFAVQLLGPSEVKVTFSTADGTELGSDTRKHTGAAEKMEYFSTVDLHRHLADSAVQADLRENRLLGFQVAYEIKQNGQVVESDTLDFAVSWQAPKTRDRDPFRALAGLDALTGTADVEMTDLALPALDSRMDPSARRVYRADYAFQPGEYGPGMLDAGRLYLALATWWPTDTALPDGWHDGTDGKQRLWLEQPGRFQLEGTIGDKGRTVTLDNDRNSTLTQASDGWLLDHQQNMTWRLASKAPLPDHATLFKGWNSAFQGKDDAARSMRYPVFRQRGGAGLPGRFYVAAAVDRQADKPWGNSLHAVDLGKAASAPTELTYQINDSGGRLQVGLTYERKTAGHVVVGRGSTGGTLAYSYDEDGYLIGVDGGTVSASHTWEPVGNLRLGDFVPKRLTSADQGAWTQAYTYDGDGLRASDTTTRFGAKTLTGAGDNGLSDTFVVTGVGGAPDRSVGFGAGQGTWLTSEVSAGDDTSTVTWTTTADSHQFLLDSFGQTGLAYTYDTRGRLTGADWTWPGAEQASSQTWTYQDDAGVPGLPTSFAHTSGSFSLEHAQTALTGGPLGDLTLAGSGAPIGGTYKAQTWGVPTATFFRPMGAETLSGRSIELSNRKLSAFPVVDRAGTYKAQLRFDYDTDGNLTRVFGPGNAVTFADFDGDGLPGTRTLNGKTSTLAYSWSSLFTITETDAVGGTATRSFDELGRLVAAAVTPAAGQAHTYTFTYDGWGRVLTATDNQTTYYDAATSETAPAPFSWSGGAPFNPDPRRNAGGYLMLMPLNAHAVPQFAADPSLLPEPLRYRPRLAAAVATRAADGLNLDQNGAVQTESRTVAPGLLGDLAAVVGVRAGATDTVGPEALPLSLETSGSMRAVDLKQSVLKPDPETNVDPCTLTILPGDHEKVLVQLGPSLAGETIFLTVADTAIARFVSPEDDTPVGKASTYLDSLPLEGRSQVSLLGKGVGQTVLQARTGSVDGPIRAVLDIKVGGKITVEIGNAATYKTPKAFAAAKGPLEDEIDEANPVQLYADNGGGARRGTPDEIWNQIKDAELVDGVVQIKVVDAQGNVKRKKTVTAALLDNKLVVQEEELITNDKGKVVMHLRTDTFEGVDEFHGMDRDTMVVLVGEAARRFEEGELTRADVKEQVKDEQKVLEHDFTGHALRFKHDLETDDGETYLTAVQVYMPMISQQQFMVFKQALFGNSYTDLEETTPAPGDQFTYRPGLPDTPEVTEAYGPTFFPSEEAYAEQATDYMRVVPPPNQTGEPQYMSHITPEPPEADEDSPWQTAYTVGAVTAELALSMAPGGDFIDIAKEYIWKPWFKGEKPNHLVGLFSLIGLAMDAGYFTGIGTAGSAVGNAVVGVIKFIFKKLPEKVLARLVRLGDGGLRMLSWVINVAQRVPGNPVEKVNRLLTQWQTILNTPLLRGQGSEALASVVELESKYLSKHLSNRAATGLARLALDHGDDAAKALLEKFGRCLTQGKRAGNLPCEALERALKLLVDDDTFQTGIDLLKFKPDAVEGLARFFKEIPQSLDEAEKIAKKILSLGDPEDAAKVFGYLKRADGNLDEVMKGVAKVAGDEINRPDMVARIVKEFAGDTGGDALVGLSFKHMASFRPSDFPTPLTDDGLLGIPRILEKFKDVSLELGDTKIGALLTTYYYKNGSDINDALEVFSKVREAPGFTDWFKNLGVNPNKVKGLYYEARVMIDEGVGNIQTLGSRINGQEGIDIITRDGRHIECKNWNRACLMNAAGELSSGFVTQVKRHIDNYYPKTLQWYFARNYPGEEDLIRGQIVQIFVDLMKTPPDASAIVFTGHGDVPFVELGNCPVD